MKKISGLNHSRWYTTASRIIRLYVSTEPCGHLCVLRRVVYYIVSVYFPVSLQQNPPLTLTSNTTSLNLYTIYIIFSLYLLNATLLSFIFISQLHLSIKQQPSILDGPKHLYNEIQAVKKYFGVEERRDILHYINTNGFFAHPENILAAMLGKLISHS